MNSLATETVPSLSTTSIVARDFLRGLSATSYPDANVGMFDGLNGRVFFDLKSSVVDGVNPAVVLDPTQVRFVKGCLYEAARRIQASRIGEGKLLQEAMLIATYINSCKR